MPAVVRLYTPAEAGAVSGLELRAVHSAIDKGVVVPLVKGRAYDGSGVKRPCPRFLTGEDLVRLRVWRGVGDTLSAERRRRLFVAIAPAPGARKVRADEFLIIDVGEARKQVERRMRDLKAAEAIVRKRRAVNGGEPAFEGTDIPVYGIVARLDAGAAVEALVLDYSGLTERMIELARVWVAAHPRRSRANWPGRAGPEVERAGGVT